MNPISHRIRHAFAMLSALILISTASYAQIYEPDGLRIPGDWNAWTNTTGMGGDFDMVKIQTGTPRWRTAFQYTGNTGTQNFKFASTSFGNPWGNQWAGNPAFQVNALMNVTFGTPSDPNNIVSVVQGNWYTVVFEDKGYVSTRAIFMQTSTAPVSITTVSQDPVIVTPQDAVAVNALFSATPAPEERLFLRYSTDGWSTSSILPMSVSGNTATANIPALPDQTQVSYYVFSTVIANPSADFDLITLNLNNNSGQNFSYLVGEQFTCGQAVSLLTTNPAFPQEALPVTIYFNAEFGNGGLYNFTGDVYAHTGVITNLSTSNTDWKYVKTEWGQNTPETKLTRVEPNLYTLDIANIRQYYGVPAAEKILKMAFVFRSGVPNPGGQYPEHKNADGSDIMAEVYEPALRVRIMNPTSRDPLASPNTVVPVCVEALQNQSISIWLDNQLLKTENTSSMAYPLILQGMAPGSYWVKAVATGNTGSVRDSVSIYLRGPVVTEALPAGVKNGINYIGNSTVTLVMNDPAGKKEFAFAIGEFSNWLPNDQNYMKRTPDGKYYWVTLTGLVSQKEYAYQYYIDGKLKIADPYAGKILDPWSDKWIPKFNYPNLKAYPFDKTVGVVSVFQTNQAPYAWEVPSFVPPATGGSQQDLMVYELLLRDFTDSSCLVTAMEKLDYLKDLGVNAIELMPVMEFDGNSSWGYAPNFFFAPDKYYGTSTDYKKFIDECHKRGMGVILDIVTNHCFGLCPLATMYFDRSGQGQPASDNPWLNPQAPHPLSVGYDFNHESPYTRDFFKQVLTFWLTEYKVDGFRFDLSKGLTQKYTGSDLGAWGQYDQSRINILSDYANHIHSVNSKAWMILEHFAENSEETVLANNGMLLWSAMHENYKQMAIGWQSGSDLARAYHANRGWNYPNLMDYAENHDQERIMAEALMNGNTSGGYNLKDTVTALNHMELTAVMMLGIPGPKMVWQFGEMGYDYSINYNGGRTAEKPPRWDYFNQPERQRLYRIYNAMAKLRKSDAFRFGSFSGDLAGKGKRMWISHSSMNVVIAGNMDVAPLDMAPGFPAAGTWYDYFSGEPVNVSDPGGHMVNFQPGDYRVYTNVPLPRPFFKLMISVKDSLTGNPIAGATVAISGSGTQRTTGGGTAGFTAFPGNVTIQVTNQGYKTATRSLAIDNDKTLTILMQKGASGIDVPAGSANVRIYPNPASDGVTIDAARPYTLELITMDHRIVRSHRMTGATEFFRTSGIPPGIYILRFTGHGEQFMQKLILRP